MTTFWHKSLEGNLCVVVDSSDLYWTVHINACLLQLSLFLELGESSSLFKLLLAGFALGLFTFGIGESRTTFLKHLSLILVHVDRVRPASFSFGVGVDFACSEPAGV